MFMRKLLHILSTLLILITSTATLADDFDTFSLDDFDGESNVADAQVVVKEKEDGWQIDSYDSVDEDGTWDPLEPVNRVVFQFNEGADKYFLEPVAEVYKDNIPKSVRDKVGNFTRTMNAPVNLANNILQGNVEGSFNAFWRPFVNIVFGAGGLVDVASEFGMDKPRHQDFGATMAKWGVPEGPYLVLPFLGPSNLRDATGRVADVFMNPLYYEDVTNALGADDGGALNGAINALRLINLRANLLQPVRDIRESSFDPYTSFKSAYGQNRRRVIGKK